MRVLVACEFSGRVRDAFLVRGHDAWSCDMRKAVSGSERHLWRAVEIELTKPWDLVIAHPPCTYLCNSGVRWLRGDRARWFALVEAVRFFKECLNANSPKVCVENPVMHGHAKRMVGVEQTQVIQPWQFGHGETKATCLWLKGLPVLKPTTVVSGRRGRVHEMPPSHDRAAMRSVTYRGVAEAMADQWGQDD